MLKKTDCSVEQEAETTSDLNVMKTGSFQPVKSRWTRVVDSFRRNQDDETCFEEEEEEDESQVIIRDDRKIKLKQDLHTRHVIMIALSTGIGTGLLVGSAKSLVKGGPASLLIGYAIVGTMLFPTIQSGGELAVAYQNLSGGFNAYAARLIDESFGFSVGWNYCIQWLCVISLELVTGSITIKYWTTTVNPDAFVAIFYVLIVIINFCGSKGYGEAEFFFNSCKVIMLTGFILFGIIVDCGKNPDNEYIGGRYWHDPGAFNYGFKGLCTVFVTAAFSLGQSEFVVLTCAEQANPRKTIPTASKQLFWRIVVFFLGSLTLVGLLVPSNSDELMGSGESATHASPFVLSAKLHHVKVVPHIINAVILLSVLSVGNSALYSASRTLQSLSEQGFAPKFFNYIDRAGRPSRALAISAFFGLFSFVAACDQEETIFNWLLAISGLSQIFTWMSICISHIRFRAALKAQGHSTDELGYVANTGLIGSYYAVTIDILILIAQFWVGLWPAGGDGKPNANNFFQSYLGGCVLLVFYVCHKIYKKNWKLFLRAEDIDIVSDRTFFDADVLKMEKLEEKEQRKTHSFWKKFCHFWC
ncbi:hypothetical protein PACTADRAFT_47407 [Pachysolen tannophilus NRRL Y-2460]|uniref:Amino acid permease/ SLC12A domain-containing protein n=1 Tax=Pachysolen tannophilus NRRL Y-2460 TaxID=669874 RepID=A0A1E4U0G8_PACTA|nr:hypothetical protein PACTADRAFT_47407 [Pachysolen tannophilus NRRL Y-2460]